MDACAAGLPRVSDRPRKTKSEVPPRLPVTTIAVSACAEAQESSATVSSDPRKRWMRGFTVRVSLKAIHVRGQSDESPTGWQAPKSVTALDARRSRARVVRTRVQADRGCDCDPGPEKPVLTPSRPIPMSASISRFADRWAVPAIVLCFAWSVACASSLLAGWGGARATEFVGAWGTTPLQLVALL